MNITSNYQLRPFKYEIRANDRQLQTNPSFGMKKEIVATGAAVTAALALETIGVLKSKTEPQKFETNYGPYVYTPKSGDKKQRFDTIRESGMRLNLFEDIPQEILESPVMGHVHQAECSTINPKVGVILMQNKSDKPVLARKIPLEGTLEENIVNSNINNIPIKFDVTKDSQYINAPWSDQYVTQKCFMVIYGTVDKDSWALDSYLGEYANKETGKAPDVAILAAEKGAEDRSFVPADIAWGQYEIVLENGERIPCDYEKMGVGKVYNIAKKEAILKMAVPYKDVVSSEGEVLKAGKLYMVDSMGHFYNGQPIKRIKSGEVTWNADMNDPVQANIRNLIDESLRLEAEAKTAKKEADSILAQVNELRKQAEEDTLNAKELNEKANTLTGQADELKVKASEIDAEAKKDTSEAEKAMTEWVKSAQNPEGVDFFAEA